ncbi:DUF2993 domain-containing protein [Corynebacterium felinum]|uniref:DUF2993 domain-containing protein n=1 Tax=Corynebacterium felinum TaxID=131318 RepID=A0ABU2B7D7_9CORY|nr:DUF2993 domain-containing protein [Corynebacterium felinum]MDF5819468.1 DUF2993 domain-containing protein [Corynebacterium felinum]MDR7354522.1 hypothetical protein [Corynebacterium felinum]WJY93889.1 hypothetical protein CFELI_01205 [Corynebacterium felinum]
MTKGKSAPKILIGIVVILVVLLFAAEFGLRWFLKNQISGAPEAGAEKSTVSFGATPVLTGIVRGEIGYLEIDAPDTAAIAADGTVTGQPKTHMVIEGLPLSQDPASRIRTMSIETTLSDDFLLAQIQNGLKESQPQIETANPDDFAGLASQFLSNLIKVSDFNSHADRNSFDVEFNNGAATLTFQPKLVNGSLNFEATKANLLGFDLPETVSQAITEALSGGFDEFSQQGLTVRGATVVDGGLQLKMYGENVPLEAMNELNTTPTTPTK